MKNATSPKNEESDPEVPQSMTLAEFLRDPKHVINKVAEGVQVCVRGANTQVLIGLGRDNFKAAQRRAFLRKTSASSFDIESVKDGPLVSWML
jgi:hypothetical protein